MRKFNRVILFAALCAGTLFIILSLEGEQDALMERSIVLEASALTVSQEPLDRRVQSDPAEALTSVPARRALSPTDRATDAATGAATAVASASPVAPTVAARAERRAGEPRNAAPTLMLNPRVFQIIEEVQRLQLDGQWEEALNELNALYTEFDSLNTFEQTTLLNYYTNVLTRFQMWPEAIAAFSRMLTIPELRPELGARALMALGQLHAQAGEHAAAVSYLESWQSISADMEGMESRAERVAQLLAQSRGALTQAAAEQEQ